MAQLPNSTETAPLHAWANLPRNPLHPPTLPLSVRNPCPHPHPRDVRRPRAMMKAGSRVTASKSVRPQRRVSLVAKRPPKDGHFGPPEDTKRVSGIDR